MSNYATKSDSKNASGVDTWKFADVDELDIDKLKDVCSGLYI